MIPRYAAWSSARVAAPAKVAPMGPSLIAMRPTRWPSRGGSVSAAPGMQAATRSTSSNIAQTRARGWRTTKFCASVVMPASGPAEVMPGTMGATTAGRGIGAAGPRTTAGDGADTSASPAARRSSSTRRTAATIPA